MLCSQTQCCLSTNSNRLQELWNHQQNSPTYFKRVRRDARFSFTVYTILLRLIPKVDFKFDKNCHWGCRNVHSFCFYLSQKTFKKRFFFENSNGWIFWTGCSLKTLSDNCFYVLKCFYVEERHCESSIDTICKIQVYKYSKNTK